MSNRLKIFLWTFIIAGSLYLVLDISIWIRYSPSGHKTTIDTIVLETKQMNPFPRKVYEAYSKVYPGWEDNYIIPDFIWIRTAKPYSNYPQCFIAAQLAHGNRFEIFMYANEIENHLTNRQCLTYMFSHFDWFHRAEGLEKAAQIYYKKAINDLTDNECLELVAMMENPSLYNKFTHPEELAKRMLKFK